MSTNSKQASENLEQKEVITDASIDQVRNLLFGAEVNELNNKREQLDKTLSDKINTLEQAFEKQLKILSSEFNHKLDDVNKHHEEHTKESSQHFKQLEHQLDELAQIQAKNHQQMEDMLNMEVADLSKQMNDQFDQLEILVQQQLDSLKEQKMNRNQLADLLMSMAQSVKQE
ncbi:hypothetical protein [Thiomicrorhabdus lithotrophica]|uniref:Uncharacterized protein n=1 Tax=Thiomicrorhabdus lithotrophica TaxID=2949997 RepID=A0ABY8C9J3_9GAMM|nr:hypothetical protein [Thiomicrorhabdus lithotrophica]WEJ62599.1 hypothetical protein NR989_11380 [Thiomicrorhabdus lithotrophica]